MALMIMRGAVYQLPEEDRKRVEECADKMRALVEEYGEAGVCAASLVALELATET